jgi:hypothetical protein
MANVEQSLGADQKMREKVAAREWTKSKIELRLCARQRRIR